MTRLRVFVSKADIRYSSFVAKVYVWGCSCDKTAWNSHLVYDCFFLTLNITLKLFTQKPISHVSKTALCGESNSCPSVQSAHGETNHKNYEKLICNVLSPQSISAPLYPKQNLSTFINSENVSRFAEFKWLNQLLHLHDRFQEGVDIARDDVSDFRKTISTWQIQSEQYEPYGWLQHVLVTTVLLLKDPHSQEPNHLGVSHDQ